MKTAGDKNNQTKRYLVLLMLLARRFWKQPVYRVLLVLIPILGGAVSLMERDDARGAAVAVCVEEGTWQEPIAEGLRQLSADSVLRFVFCDDEASVERCVAVAEADCGFVVGADIAERVMSGEWSKTITVYETSASSVTGAAKERIAAVIFRIYSEQCYGDYMRDISEEFGEFAREAYERRLADGSTFAFRYRDDNQISQYSYDTNVINDTVVFPVKGAFGVIIFISGMCGMLEYDRDRQEKRFARVMPNALTYIVDIWLPTFFVSAAALLCLWLADGVRADGGTAGAWLAVWSPGMWRLQIGQLIAYQLIVVAYCGILGLFLKRQETIAAAIPVLSLGSLVCAPVFVRLAAYLPVFAVLEKLFPVSYYLLM
ncbi:MAG: hypothetical protein NC311_19215 [Muribaculaceae bacterium]|nr:hypothetical protein [Muribaculaceae bacterium]